MNAATNTPGGGERLPPARPLAGSGAGPSAGAALRRGGLASLWVAVAALMIRDGLADPFDPGRLGTAAYGHNHEGAILEGLVWTFTEVVIVYAILRPGSYHHSYGRALAALALLAPWTGLSMVLTMHAGGIVALHFVWLAVLTIVVAGLALISGISGISGIAAARARASRGR